MNNQIITIKNVRAYQDKNGIAQLNLEDVARGLGFTESKNGVEYVRWRTIEGYLKEFNFATSCEKEYIPENIFYKLCFKAKNEIARRFQDIVTDEILPAIRKTGGYIAGEKNMSEDELVLKAIEVMQRKVKQLEEKTKKLATENSMQFQLIGELKPKADYLDTILKSKSIVPVSYIAKDYGMSARTFNKKLHELGIQYKIGDTWLLYSKYQACGYTHGKITEFYRTDGTLDTKTTMEWTQKGRLFLYELLKKNGIIPMIER